MQREKKKKKKVKMKTMEEMEEAEIKMVEMKMAESDNKSGWTQREKAGSSPVWFQLPAIHASSPTPEENTFISSIYSIY